MDDQELAKTMANEHELALLDRKSAVQLRELRAICFTVFSTVSAIVGSFTAWNIVGT